MSGPQNSQGNSDYGPQRLTIELTDICNLHCSYCLRDEDALYGRPTHYFPVSLLRRVVSEARDAIGITAVTFTGGEPTLHPQFSDVLAIAAETGLKTSFVTNGWNFEKLWPVVLKYRESISHVAFSIDGVTAAEHDAWRGAGSFVRLIAAFSRCHIGEVPFVVKVGIRRDSMDQLEKIAMFAARFGAAGLSFSHLLPTSSEIDDESALTLDERTIAEQEIATLRRIFKMNIGIDVGYYNIDPEPPCSPLLGTSCNIDYRGRLTLCCNLSGYRGGSQDEDIVADLNQQSFTTAYSGLREIARKQMERRSQTLRSMSQAGQAVDLFTGSPCLLCLKDFGKIPWLSNSLKSRSLPVMNTTPVPA